MNINKPNLFSTKSKPLFFGEISGEIRNFTISGASFQPGDDFGVFASSVPQNENAKFINLKLVNTAIYLGGNFTQRNVGFIVGNLARNSSIIISESSINGIFTEMNSNNISRIGTVVGNMGFGRSVTVHKSLIDVAFDYLGDSTGIEYVGGISGWSRNTYVDESTIQITYNLKDYNAEYVGGLSGRIESNSSNDINTNISNSFIQVDFNFESGPVKTNYYGSIAGVSWVANNSFYTIYNTLILTNINGDNSNFGYVDGNMDNSHPNMMASGEIILLWDFDNNMISSDADETGLDLDGFTHFDSTEYLNLNSYGDVESWSIGDSSDVWLMEDGVTLPYLAWQEEPLPDQIITQP